MIILPNLEKIKRLRNKITILLGLELLINELVDTVV